MLKKARKGVAKRIRKVKELMPKGIYFRTKKQLKRLREIGEKTQYQSGGNHPRWNPNVITKPRTEKVKDYRLGWKTYNYRRIKMYRQVNLHSKRAEDKLDLETIQLIYEDNIKKYGTLTCIYCLNSIKFGNDSIDHKIPISRGGTNLYENLAIACISCNSRKRDKTESEFEQYKEDIRHG